MKLLLMGILNVTPDSFSDGGRYQNASDAVRFALQMIEDGADLIDVGGESTRPRAEPVSLDDELRRVLPVVEELSAGGIQVSVDTMKPEVARRALAAGARVINDVTALREPEMREICAGAECTVCLMHMKGEPRTMQESPAYEDVVSEVREFLLGAAHQAEAAGVKREKIWLDPGIGFGKTVEHNLALLRNLDKLVETGYPVLVGVSRKSFLGKFSGTGVLPVEERLPGTLAAQVLAQAQGARIIRAHDVLEARRAIDVASAILGYPAGSISAV
ncbi:dihydropteroate synthase [Fimbriimonas ginsengisoli]|uniref:Dihydropteroate synthase n=1 Tax=Fimbriimonas ginsengisoli Gsoil 348 TaxID=661478 RepID=A0A068NTI4_FIMGI|nr:dihydropteroate synthase [Fimbriimonas ginsengisoli]AIE86756.1 dihydropteroate synthase [Fimbriimonas ginsengisoli Gsoil 348]